MKALLIVVVVTLLALAGAYWWRARDSGATVNAADAVASVQEKSGEPAVQPAAENRQIDGERNSMLALEIERALVARDPQQRETAFNFLLPELLQADPGRVVTMVAAQEPGEARDALRSEVARQWVRMDQSAATEWIKSFADEAERRSSAQIAVQTLAAGSPGEAVRVADQFGIGRDDGYLEHMVQLWAESDIRAATDWLATQPDDARTAPLRARIEQVREQQQQRAN